MEAFNFAVYVAIFITSVFLLSPLFFVWYILQKHWTGRSYYDKSIIIVVFSAIAAWMLSTLVSKLFVSKFDILDCVVLATIVFYFILLLGLLIRWIVGKMAH